MPTTNKRSIVATAAFIVAGLVLSIVLLLAALQRGSRGPNPRDQDKPFSGQFLTRVSPDLHRGINLAAARAGKSLNAWVTEQLEKGTRDAALARPAKARRRKLA
jgi:hypothetical protein